VSALYLLSIWLHIIAASIWIGGTIFLAAVLVPMIRRPEYRAFAPAMLQSAGERFRKIGWASLLVLMATGVTNLAFRRFAWTDVATPQGWNSRFGQTLAEKLLVVATIMVLSLAHDLWVGRRATAAWLANPSSEETRRLRRQASWIGRINLLLSLIAAALGVMLVRGRP
jgi:uncharacterized membrane protein